MRGSESSSPPLAGASRWLLIGNSRWHWAEATSTGLRTWHEAQPAAGCQPGPATPLAWAAVGAVPATAGLPDGNRLQLGDVPLRDAPGWLGIDRALAGWQAWRQAGGRPVLVADAGTVLSLTRVDGEGRFAGGRLMAGVALQLRGMAAGTQALPALMPETLASAEPWPRPTAAAMREGTIRGLAAAVAAAAREAFRADAAGQLVLTGGDGALLEPLLRQAIGDGLSLIWRPELCLEAISSLRPGPGPGLGDAANGPG